jgi:hypothetical protein
MSTDRLERTTFHAAEAAIAARNAADTARDKLATAPAGAPIASLLALIAVQAQIATAAADVANAALSSLHHTTRDRATLLDARDATNTADDNAKAARDNAARAIVEYS